MEYTDASPLSQAIALHRQGALTDAAHQYEQLVQHDPANADALYGLAQVSCQQGQLARGVEFAHRALAVDSRRARTHRLLGMALGAWAHRSAASFDRAIARPGRASESTGAARVLAVLNGGDRELEQALTLRPDPAADVQSQRSFSTWTRR
jgi:thioredoxin-like negative regulator of GroEL